MIIYPNLKDYVIPSTKQLLVDLRSLSHFRHGSIPHAVHLPLFLKPNIQQTLLQHPLQRINPQSFFEDYSGFLQSVNQLRPATKQLIFFCEDGGWKSRLVHRFLKKEVPQSRILSQGYAGFTNALSIFFAQDRPYYLLIGKTGCGKTKVLQALQEKGEQVLDLEALSNHRGSVFGQINKNLQPSSPQFHNLLMNSLLTPKFPNKIFVEQKGRLIGRCKIPTALFQQFAKAKKILFRTSKEKRVDNILRDYQYLDTHSIQNALEKIKPRLGVDLYTQCQKALSQKDRSTFVDHLLTYYDSVANYQYLNQETALQVDCDQASIPEIVTCIREMK